MSRFPKQRYRIPMNNGCTISSDTFQGEFSETSTGTILKKSLECNKRTADSDINITFVTDCANIKAESSKSKTLQYFDNKPK